MKADAATLNPYMGFDSVEPFINYKDKGVFILCLTSNPGAADFQQMKTGKKKLFELVADKAEECNRINKNIGLVVGATKPKELEDLRRAHRTLPFLIPGIGTQHGDLENAVINGAKYGALCIFNVSRQILYPGGSMTQRGMAIEIKKNINKFYGAPTGLSRP